jgi:hypothetical protein
MSTVFDPVVGVLGRVVTDVGTTVIHVWPFLVLSVLLAAALTTYVDTERLAVGLRRRTAVAVLGAVALATLTPFCSCGTTAVVLGALATRVPWAPLVAFMVASPLTSPEEYALSVGLFGWPFTTTFFVGTILLGLLAGAVTSAIEPTGWLAGQSRLRAGKAASGCRSGAEQPLTCAVDAAGSAGSAGPTSPAVVAVASRPRPTLRTRWKLDAFARDLVATTRRLALYFFGFATVGYLVIETVPTAWLVDYLGAGSAGSVPLAALLGIPMYLNTEGSLPLVAALMQAGMGPGAALAFLITGAGTSVGAIGGLFVIARARVVALVVGLLFTGAILVGWLAPLWL